jgi:hypothetical protein
MISLPGPDQPDRRSRHKIKEIVVGLQDLTPKAFSRFSPFALVIVLQFHSNIPSGRPGRLTDIQGKVIHASQQRPYAVYDG